jgi:uncharacterized membrane protein
MRNSTVWLRLRRHLDRFRAEERGDVVNWLIITLGVAIAAAAVITVLQPAIESAGQQIANLVGG